jgi:uncharacterized protein
VKLHLSHATGTNTFTAYGTGYVSVNGQRFERSLIVLPDRILADWAPESFDALAPAHLDALVGAAPEVVLLGTGARQQFPDVQVLRILHQQRIGVEVMDTSAACRTYNVLVTEGRNVAAALIV